MKNFYYNIALFFSWVSEYFSSQKHLFSARHAMIHELVNITMHKDDITKKNPAILLAIGKFDQILVNKPSDTQSELGHVLLKAKTRRGKSLNAETNCLTWPYPLIANDIKKELWSRTAGWREKGLGGKAIMFDPRGNGGRFDPLEGLNTEFQLKSAASTLLFRQNEGENQIFTDSAITMLTQIFIAARLEEKRALEENRIGERPLPFTYRLMNKGFYGAATILELISIEHNYQPNLATVFLDINYDKADFNSRFLRDCWSTLTRRMRRVLTKESVRCFTGSDFTAKDIITSGERPISVYLCWPEQHLLSLSPLIQLVWDSLFNGMIAHYDAVRGAGCSRVLAVLDEILRTGMPKLPDYATTVCGRDITLFVPVQSESQLYAAYGQYNAEVLKEQFDYIINYRPAPAGNRTAHNLEESLGYTSGFAQSRSEYERGSSQGESEQKIPLMPSYETKLLKDRRVIVEIDGKRSTIAQRLDWRDFPELAGRAQMPPPEIRALHPRDAKEMDIGADRLAPVSSWRDDPALLRHRNYAPAYLEAENPMPPDREGWN